MISATPPDPIGIIGLGRMGSAIAHRLLDLGQTLVVWNRTGTAAELLAQRGARIGETPGDVVTQCPVSLVIVRDSAALKDVYGSEGGILGAKLSGRVVVDMTTAPHSDILHWGNAVNELGGRFLDAPMSGTVEPARNGQLVIAVGGGAKDLQEILPLLAMISRKVIPAGPIGSGIVMKLVLNLPLATYWQAVGEAFAIGHQYGLSLEAMLSTLVDSKAAIGALPSKVPQIVDAQAPVQFDLAGLHKDLLAMCETAERVSVDVPVARAAAKSAGEAVLAGWGRRDLAQLVRFVAGQPTKFPK